MLVGCQKVLRFSPSTIYNIPWVYLYLALMMSLRNLSLALMASSYPSKTLS